MRVLVVLGLVLGIPAVVAKQVVVLLVVAAMLVVVMELRLEDFVEVVVVEFEVVELMGL